MRAVTDAPSFLGPRPTGVESMPEALLRAGFLDDALATDNTLEALNPPQASVAERAMYVKREPGGVTGRGVRSTVVAVFSGSGDRCTRESFLEAPPAR